MSRTPNTNGMLDPAKFSDLYSGKGELKGESFYFGPFTLKEATDGDIQSLTQTARVTNYSELGAVQVTKYSVNTEGEKLYLPGAVIGIYEKDDGGKLVQIGNGQTVGKDGTTVFYDLPIYDSNGDKITYYVKEISAPEGYTLSDKVLEVKLTPGETVTENDEGLLELINLPKMDFQVTKVFKNLWEWQFTNKDYKLLGAQIALYEKQDDDSFELVDIQVTDELGKVLFEDLDQDKEYAAVEYSIPAAEEYRYLVPENGGKYLAEDYTDAPPKTLTDDSMKDYYYVTKPAIDNGSQGSFASQLTNVEHWTQLHIKKYIMVYNDDKDETPEVERLINNASFDLYMYVVPENSETTLTYTDGNNDYIHIGSYSSGTLYDSDGVRRDGWFGTDILKAGNDVVYWLVERSAGTGATIKADNQVVLIKPEGSKYTNNSHSVAEPGTLCEETIEYKLDTVTEGEVENDPITGGGGAMFSTVRIAKWADQRDADGELLKKYTPLGNASFELWLVHEDGSKLALLDTLTTGLDNNLSGNAEEAGLTAWASSMAFSFDSLYEKYGELNSSEEDIVWMDDAGNGYVRVLLEEVSIPGGYATPETSYKMIMFFQAPADENKTTETFNDAYYVKEAAGDTTVAAGDIWALYPTKETGPGKYEYVDGAEGAGRQYRIVNIPIDNFAVTVTKYGYEVTSDTIEKTSGELDTWFQTHTGRSPIGVTMKLQRYSPTTGSWSDYTYPGSTNGAFFTTDSATGYFAFPNGLTVGRYRIIETGANGRYENIYDGSALDGGNDFYSAKAYYFTVTNSNLNLNIYNPEKLALELVKQDTEGAALSGAVFRLTGAATLNSSSSGMDGTVTIDNIGSGVYVLSEVTAPGGYSKVYLKQYMESVYADGYEYNGYSLGNFATEGKGIWLGYETEQRGNEVVVTQAVDLGDYGVDGLQLMIEDPALSSLKIIKTDDLTGNGLADAVFKVEYRAFNSWNGDESLTADGGWKLIGKNYKTAGDEGSVTLQNLEPGVYKITETVPPTGYDLSGEAKYMVLTGGMNKTVGLDGEELPADGGELSFANPQQVSLTVEKVVRSGELTVEGNHRFTFELYDSDKTTLLQSKTVTVTDGAKDGDVYPAVFTGLSQGKTYYLKELNNNVDFAMTAVKGSGSLTVTQDAENNELYGFTVPSGSAEEITISAENTYLYGEVVILKIDGTNGSPLDGAAFGAYRKEGDHYLVNLTGEWRDEGGGSGEYTVRLPLTGAAGNTFKIQELSAPTGYVLEHPFTDVTVEPGQIVRHGNYDKATMGTTDRNANNTAMLSELIFPNYQGTVITVKKYGDMRESSNPQVLSGAGFTLYVRNDESEWEQLGTVTTGSDGTAGFTVDSGKVYALAETQVPDGFQRLQGIYDASNGQAMTVETQGNRIYYLVNNGQAVATGVKLKYEAYNIPYLELELRKMDTEDSGKAPAPSAKMNVYEVPDSTADKLSMDQVKELMDNNAPILTDVVVSTAGAENGENYSYANSNTMGALGNTIVGGKTYLVVETQSSYSQVRDNGKVVWYSVLRVPAGTRDKQIVTLKNLDAGASHRLDKTTTTPSYPSLMSRSAVLEYTITPEVNNSYPLDSFILKDSGLTAKSGDIPLDFDNYLKDKYSITQVTVGKSSHDTSAYSASANNKLRATVNFYGFDDTQIYSETVDVSDADQTVVLSSVAKAKYVTVNYRSEEFEQASGYSLGQNFQPGPVKIQIELDKQDGGVAVRAISRVTNTAETTMSWRPWTNTGEQEGSKSDTKTATATNTFGELTAALISVEKTADRASVELEGGVIGYTITVSNADNATAAMQKPFLVDLLPQGTVLHGEDGGLKIVNAPAGMSVENKRSTTYGGETAFFVFFDGELAPGDSVTVRLEIEATKSAALYGADIWNNVIVGSRAQGVQSTDNPLASSWKTKDGKWPDLIDTALAASMAQNRKEALKIMLDDMSAFGYISSSTSVAWSASADASLVKTGRGDRTENQGFSSTRLSAVNNAGYMDYQLIFSNVSKNSNFTNATLLDVLPFVGDKASSGADRYSKWGMEFGGITDVYRVKADGNTIPITNYKLFCYTGSINSSNINAVYAQAENLKYDSETLPANWVEGTGAQTAAIAVAIEQDAETSLAPGESYVVQFRMNVDDLNEEELAARSWTNTVNNFNCHYFSYTADINTASPSSLLSSNSVSATILPEPVKVGGHVWIDKDADGIWDADEYVDDPSLSGRAIVQKLLDSIEVRLNTFEGTGGSSSFTSSYDTEANPNWSKTANFIFKRLDPASPNENITDSQLYSGSAPVNLLDPSQLKGTAPKTYNISVTIPDSAGLLTRVTDFGANSGYSRYPTQLNVGGIHADEARDNNYVKASNTSSVSERFFLYATAYDVFDNTKDIGLVLERKLVINKYAADNGDNVEGAEFKVYGPFASVAQATAAQLNDSNLVKTVKTDANGEADFGNLNWFYVYVIVESAAAPGYKLDGAKGTNTDGVLSDYKGTSTAAPAWILDIPAEDITNTVQVVNVSNKRDIQYTLKASKELDGKALTADMFSFELLNENMQQIEIKTNDAQGQVMFTPISAESEGDFTYYIKELIPVPAENGYTYDESLYKAQVTVTWDDKTDNLKAAVSYFIQEADGTWTAAHDGAEFVNEYEATPIGYAPKVEKSFAEGSREPAEGDSFSFELAFAAGDSKSVVMPADTTVTVTGKGTASFGEITFKAAGSYTFTIKEKVDSSLEDFGYSFDATEWTLTVEIIDTDGVLSVQSHIYTATGKQDSTEQATFENGYTPVEFKYAPTVRKTITGDTPPTKESFSFSLALAKAEPIGGAILPSDTTVNVVGEGTAGFEEITFRAAGTYIFIISEEKGSAQGYTYDDRVWTLTVKTKLENGNLVLDGAPVYKQDSLLGASSTTEAEFENEFENFVEFAPAVFKSFSVDSDPRPGDVIFSFTLKPNANYSGVEMPGLLSSTATVTGYGKGYFDAIKFSEAGTYLFTITEVNGKAYGYTYDSSKWTISVTIGEDANGQLSVDAVSYAKQGSNIVLADYASFVNSFDREKVPKTGDSSNLPGYTAALLGSAGALTILEYIRRKLRKG